MSGDYNGGSYLARGYVYTSSGGSCNSQAQEHQDNKTRRLNCNEHCATMQIQTQRTSLLPLAVALPVKHI